MEISNYIFKILVLGKASSGKTSLVDRFAKSIFSKKYNPTLGLNLVSKIIKIDDRSINLSIWDTGGFYDFDKLTYFYFKGSSGVIIVIDSTDPKGIQKLDKYISSIEAQCSHIPIIIALNKSDLDVNLQEEVEKVIKPWREHWRKSIELIECSAKLGENVVEIFTSLSSEILQEVIEDEKFDVNEYI